MTKISQLPADTSPTSDDYVPSLDNATSTLKKTTWANVFAMIKTLTNTTIDGASNTLTNVLASTHRSNNGTNTTESAAKIQTGWVCGQPGAAAAIAFHITFPTAFTNVPIVLTNYGGDTSGVTSTLGSGGLVVKGLVDTEVYSVTTTDCYIRALTTDGTNWSSGNTVYMHWIAIGT